MPLCDYCRGPITGAAHAGRPWPGRAAAAYCCYGCLSLGEQQRQLDTAPALPAAGHSLGSIGVRLGFALIVVAQSMIFGLALNLHDDVPPDVRWGAQTLILGATLVVVALLGPPLFRAAWLELRRGRVTVESLFLLTMFGALGASLQAYSTGRGKIYFEVVSILLVVYTLGKLIGARSRAAAMAGARAWAGQLDMCRLVDDRGRTRSVLVREVLPGDVVEVNPGETFAVDGVIRSGTGFVSEAAVSGEPFAAVRRPGDRVLAGAASHDAAFRVEATAPGTERQVDRLLAAVEGASDRPVSLQARADALGRWFLPLVACVALGTFAYWTLFTAAGWEAALFHAMSVLLVACPCVIGLATPVVVWSALGRLAERGVIVRAAAAVERLAEVDRVMLDKTGTLTDDSLSVLDVVTAGTDRERLLGWLSVIEEKCNHPVARAFAKLPRPAGTTCAFASCGLCPGAASRPRSKPAACGTSCRSARRSGSRVLRFLTSPLVGEVGESSSRVGGDARPILTPFPPTREEVKREPETRSPRSFVRAGTGSMFRSTGGASRRRHSRSACVTRCRKRSQASATSGSPSRCSPATPPSAPRGSGSPCGPVCSPRISCGSSRPQPPRARGRCSSATASTTRPHSPRHTPESRSRAAPTSPSARPTSRCTTPTCGRSRGRSNSAARRSVRPGGTPHSRSRTTSSA